MMQITFFLLIILLAGWCLVNAAIAKPLLKRRVWLGYYLDFVGAGILFSTFFFPHIDNAGFYTLLGVGAAISTIGTVFVWWQGRRVRQ